MLWSYPVKVALQAIIERRPTRHFVRGFAACYLFTTGMEMAAWETLVSECWYDSALYAAIWPIHKASVIFGIEMIQDWAVAFTSCGGG